MADTSSVNTTHAFDAFWSFFSKCPFTEGKHPYCTHTIIKPGSRYVPNEKHKEFVEAYCAAILNSNLKIAIVERRDGLDHAFVLIDVDIEGVVKGYRVYSPHHVEAFAQAVARVIQEFVECDGDFNVIITEKRQGTAMIKKIRDGKKVVSEIACNKDGWHLYVPEIVTTREVQYAIRRRLLQQLPEILDGIEPLNDNGWDDVLDERVISKNGIVLLGSRKPNGYHYDVTRVFTYKDFRLIAEETPGFPSGADTGKMRVHYLKRFDLFQRSAFNKQAMSPTKACLFEIELHQKLQTVPVAKAGRPSKEDVLIRDVPMETPDLHEDMSLMNAKAPPLSLVDRAIVIIARHADEGYDTWFKIGFELASLVCADTSFEDVARVFIKFSRASTKFNKNEAADKFLKLVNAWRNSHRRPKRTWRSLFSRLYAIKKDHPSELRECKRILSALKGYMHVQGHCDIRSAHPWQVVEDYAQDRCRPFYPKGESEDKTLIAIQSCMSSGKTFQIEQFLKERSDASFIMISTRRSYARNVVARLLGSGIEVVLYIDDSDPASASKLMISIESFFKVGKEYDIVILDELTAISAQFMSETVANLPGSYSAFARVIARAKQIVCLDAMLTKPSLQFIHKLAPGHDARLYVNTVQRLPRTYRVTFAQLPQGCSAEINVQTFLLFETIANGLRDGKVIKFATASKRVGDHLIRHLRKFHPDVYEEDKILFISSDTPGKDITYFIDNMHKVLQTKRLLIHTSTMSVGVDYSEPGVFDNSIVYGVASSGQTGVDLLQQDMRVRHINDSVVRVFYSQAICSYLPMTTEAVQKECSRKKASMNMLFDQKRKEHAWTCMKELLNMNETNELTMAHVREVLDEYKSYDRVTDEVPAPLRELHEAHTIDHSHWAAHYAPMFEETVKRMGHRYEEVHVDMTPYAEMLKLASPEDYDDEDDEDVSLYDRIEELTPDGYAQLRRVQKAGNADLETNLRIKKYIFDLNIARFPREIQQRITHMKRCKIFFLLSDKQSENVFLQMATEFCDSSELIQKIAEYRPYAMQIKAAEACLPHIKRICNILGLLHTLDVHPTIKRGTIENNMDDLNYQCKQVIKLLKIRDQSDGEVNFKSVVKCISNVLGNWSGMYIRDVVADNKRATQELKLHVKDVQSAKIANIIFGNY